VSDFVWEDPPPDGRGLVVLSVILDELRARPGEWARVAAYSTPASAGPIARRLKNAGAEATSRKLPDGTGGVWARWPEDKDATA